MAKKKVTTNQTEFVENKSLFLPYITPDIEIVKLTNTELFEHFVSGWKVVSFDRKAKRGDLAGLKILLERFYAEQDTSKDVGG